MVTIHRHANWLKTLVMPARNGASNFDSARMPGGVFRHLRFGGPRADLIDTQLCLRQYCA